MTVFVPVLLISLLGGPAAAGPYAEGARIPALSLPDQHGETRQIDANVRAILFARDMDGGGVLKEALAESGPSLLEGAGAVYVADVSRMPGLIRRFFALPSLRRRDYPILIDTDGSATERFPSSEGQATLMVLDSLRLVGVSHFGSAAELRAALEKARPAEEPPTEP
jgi:hypothetical protein